MEVMYISYDEAQALIPFFRHSSKNAPYSEAKESARRVLEELELVRRDISYSPLKGRQIFLRSSDKQFLMDAISALEVR